MFDDYIDEIELEYSTFLAEQELFDNLITLGGSIYHESVGLVVVQEDFKNTINTYIEKIVTGIQKAWNTFKEKVIDFEPAKKIIDNVNKKLNSYDGTAEVQYWHTYNFGKFDSLKTIEFNKELLDSCENKTDYYTKAFSGFYTNKDISLKENIINQIIDTQDSHVITKEDVDNMIDFCTRGFKERVNKLQTDLNSLNTNITSIKSKIGATISGGENQTVQTVQQQTEVQHNSVNILTSLYESYMILNEDNDENNNKSAKVVKNTDAGADDKTKNDQSKSVKEISWYLSANTDVISAKMKILRQRYLDAIKIFRAIFPKEKEKKETDQVEVKQTAKKVDQIEV